MASRFPRSHRTEKRSTILFCCNTTFGIVNFRSGAVREFLARGHRVVIVAPADEHTATLKAMGAEFIHWELCGRGSAPLQEARSLRQLVEIYRRLRPQLAFNFTIKPVLYGAIAGRRTATPVISVVTGLGYVFLNSGFTSRAAKLLYRLTLSWSREVWFLNEDDRALFITCRLVLEEKSRLLPGEGIDTTFFAPQPFQHREAPVFLMVSRLLQDKGVFEYVEAARQLRAAGLCWRFQLLGSADPVNPSAIPRTELNRWIEEGTIEYLGTTRDVRPYISRADCVVLPSYREGISRSLMEAAAIGRPIIATDVPGCREIVIHGQNGLLCAPRNADSLKEAMKEFAQLSPSQRAHMGQEGRQIATERFEESLIVRHYVRTLQSILPPQAAS